MANEKHVALLKQGVEVWNAWRKGNPDVQVDLYREDLSGALLNGANLAGANLIEADLSEALLNGANLTNAQLAKADLTKADLTGAHLNEANLTGAKMYRATLIGAHLCETILNGAYLYKAEFNDAHLTKTKLYRAYLCQAILSGAHLYKAEFHDAHLSEADFTNATLTDCRVYGISAWRLKRSEGTKQRDLIITRKGEPEVRVDDIEVAQFIYLLLDNQKIRDVIDTVTSKAVLILGRFSDERKKVLDALWDELRNRGYVPILFDFEKPRSQTTLETISTLAHMARLVIADITDAKSVLQELQAVVPLNPSVAVQPLVVNTQAEPGMFDFFRQFRSVLETYRYDNQDQLIADLSQWVIYPAESKVEELRSAG